MFASLLGIYLNHCTRPTGSHYPLLTAAMTLNMLAWTGMSVNDLRAKMLSVYVGRARLLFNMEVWNGQRNVYGKAT